MKRLYLALLLLTSCSFAVQRTLELPEGCTSWGRLPLSVAIDESAVEYRDDVNRGMKAWNDAMGRPAFTWVYVDEVAPDVIVVAGPTGKVREKGHTGSECRGARVLSAVLLAPALDASAATAFATHELGHVLGLGHASNESSVMHATIDVDLMGQWDDDHAPKLYRITETDARLANLLHSRGSSALEAAADDDPGTASGIGTSPSAPDIDKDAAGFASSMLSAVKSGQWRLLAGLLLIALVWAARKWGAGVMPWLKTDRGGAFLVLLLAELGGLATTLAGDAPFTWGTLVNSLSMAFTAAGGFTVIKKLLAPSDKRADGK
jgi:hypothetical protein